MKLSEHFTLGELTKTSYKTEDGNIPSRVAIENLKNLCENWLEDLRYSYNTLYPRDYPQDVVRQAHQPSERSLSLPRSTEGRLLWISTCRDLSRQYAMPLSYWTSRMVPNGTMMNYSSRRTAQVGIGFTSPCVRRATVGK